MNDLRLILLVSGLALIGGLYAWGVYQQRDLRRRQTVSHEDPPFDLPRLRPVPDDSSPVAIDLRPADAGAETETGLSAPPDIPVFPAPAERGASPVHSRALAQAAAAAEGITTLHVAASGRPFAGRAILDAMRAADLRYGQMKIFHRHNAGASPVTPPRFSVADMFEPGSFELDSMDEYTTRGLTLFMNADAVPDPGLLFDEMLDAAEMLARDLGGEVLTGDRKPLDAVRIEAMRAQFRR